MTKSRAGGENIRRFILDNVEKHSTDISKVTAKHFNITRQAVHKHLQKLTAEHVLAESGQTRNKAYTLAPLSEWRQAYTLTPELAEDVIWRTDITAALGNLPGNTLDVWQYGFTEMFKNAMNHSSGSEIVIRMKKTANNTEMWIIDNGVGIFKNIQTTLNLLDERHAILELSKGKLTTDPKHYTGEGIFFTSRLFDSYVIFSGEVCLTHQFDEPDSWTINHNPFATKGTRIGMRLQNHTTRTSKQIFDQYASRMTGLKTVVPVKLAQYENEQLISRSQAKRLLERIASFKMVTFDFKDVEFIGQAFADEIFRVFALEHPEIELRYVSASFEVKQMIQRIKSKEHNTGEKLWEIFSPASGLD